MSSPFYFRFFLFIFLTFFTSTAVFAQFYEKAYGNNTNTNGVFFAKTSDKGIVILANSVDSVFNTFCYTIIKIDSNGSELWKKNISDASNAYANSITTLADGKIVILGTHAGPVYQNVADVQVLDSLGNYLYSSLYPPFNGWGTSGVGLTNSSDSTVSITIYNDGFISNNYYSVFTLNSDLSTNWNDFTGFDGSFTTVHGLSSLPGQVVYTIAYYDLYIYSVNLQYRVTSLRKHSNSGVLLIDSLYQFSCVTSSVSNTNDGGAVICGTQDTTLQQDIVLIRIDTSGNVLWQKQYGSLLDEEANSVVETHDGGFLVLATVADSILPAQNDLFLLKTNANGDSLWSCKFGGVFNDKALHVAEDSTGIIMMGSTNSFGDDHILIVRTDTSGKIQSPYYIIPDGRYFCQNDTATLILSPTPDSTLIISWSDGDTLLVDKVTTTGNYFAVITDSLGHSIQTPSVPVYFTKLPDASFGTDTISLCTGSSLTDTASAELTNVYQWFLNGQTLPNENLPSIVPQQKGSYTLVVTNYCSSDSVTSFIDTLFELPLQPVITSPAINLVCSGDSLLLSITPVTNETYQWFTVDVYDIYPIQNATDSLYYVLDNGNYLVKSTNVNGCFSYSLPKPVSFDLNKEIVNHTGPATFCQGGEVELFVPSGNNFQWSSGDTTQFITVRNSGNYSASFINANGCPKNSDTIAITVFANPVITLGSDTNLCNNASLLLDAGIGYTNYFWSDGSSGQTLLALPHGFAFPDTSDFIAFVTDSNGCTDSDTLRIVFDLCNGILLQEKNEYRVYPNPVKSGDFIYFDVPGKDQLIFLVYDVLGREIKRMNFSDGNDGYKTKDLFPGMYYFKIILERKLLISGKLLVQ